MVTLSGSRVGHPPRSPPVDELKEGGGWDSEGVDGSGDQEVGVEPAVADGGAERAPEGAVGGDGQLRGQVRGGDLDAEPAGAGPAAADDGPHDVVFIGDTESSVQRTELFAFGVVGRAIRVDGGGEPDPDAAGNQSGDGVEHRRVVLWPAHCVVGVGIGPIQGDLDRHWQLTERGERVQTPARK